MTNNNRSQIELEVQRRVCDALAGAGLSEGSLSREVVYMLPDSFIRVYIRLFNAALKEGVVQTGWASAAEEVAKVKTGSGSYGNRGGTSNHPFPKGALGEGGKRYRTYWTILSEQAFFVKKSVDRKLRRLASHIEDDLKRRTEGAESVGVCAACAYAIGLLADAGLTPAVYCPQCGEQVERKHTNRPIAKAIGLGRIMPLGD